MDTIPGQPVNWQSTGSMAYTASTENTWSPLVSDSDPDLIELLEKAERLDAILRTAGDAIISADDRGIIHHFNPAAESIFGYTADEAVGQNLSMLMPEPHSSRHDDYIRNYERSGEEKIIGRGRELEALRRDGTRFPIELNVTDTGLRDPRLFIGIVRDITERKQQEEERLHYYANYDTLTGLPNPEHSLELFTTVVEQARTHEEHAVILIIRLRQFRHIAPSYGHKVADSILRQVANRLREQFSDRAAVIGRFQGSRFTVAMNCFEEEEGDIPTLANELVNALSIPYRVAGHEFRLHPKVGVAIYPGDGDGVEALVSQAETALSRIEESAHIPVAFANDTTDTNLRRQLSLDSDLHQALARGEFFLDYQPQYSLRGEHMVAVEALLRWRHPKLGIISPGEFIPLLESSGLIIEVGEWILHEAFGQASAWEKKEGLPPIRMAVNLSSLQLERGGLVNEVAGAMEHSGLSEDRIELELTESQLINNQRHTRRQFQTLQGMGLRIAMDDFGTGYSALSYLHSFPLHTLKIDRSFIHAIGCSRHSEALLRSIVDLGRNLEMQVVAEGIETPLQLSFLRQIGCNMVQGFALARPQSPEGVAALLAEGGRLPS